MKNLEALRNSEEECVCGRKYMGVGKDTWNQDIYIYIYVSSLDIGTKDAILFYLYLFICLLECSWDATQWNIWILETVLGRIT